MAFELNQRGDGGVEQGVDLDRHRPTTVLPQRKGATVSAHTGPSLTREGRLAEVAILLPERLGEEGG